VSGHEAGRLDDRPANDALDDVSPNVDVDVAAEAAQIAAERSARLRTRRERVATDRAERAVRRAAGLVSRHRVKWWRYRR
jgi:hypothetical protein